MMPGSFLEMELTAAEVEKALSELSQCGADLLRIEHTGDLTVTFTVKFGVYEKISSLCRRRGYALRVVREWGVHLIIERIRKRKILAAGLCAILLCSVLLPTRILFVRVDGNTSIPSRRILTEAEKCGISFWASRKEIRSEKVKNYLLDAIPQLKWAGVNTYGCTAVISVRERNAADMPQESHGVSNIIADRDGYILSAVTMQGTAQVQPGQAVRKGQILISGYTPCDICILATQAKGEIIARTRRELKVLAPSGCLYREAPQGIGKRFSLLLGKKRIFFWKDSGISGVGCGRMYREYTLSLPGGFRLPIAVGVDTYERHRVADGEYQISQDELKDFSVRYLKTQMISGVIQRLDTKLSRAGDVFRMESIFECTEAIGKVVPEQIGESHGKASGEDRERRAD